MFLRFGVENFLSIRDYTELSFLGTRLKDDDAHSTMDAGKHSKYGALPVLGLYGGNASGKSAAVRAVLALSAHVRDSFHRRANGPVPTRPFQLHETSRGAESGFDCDMLIDGVRYHYGFRFTAAHYTEEWLHAWPNGSEQRWFHRKGPDKATWYFGPGLRGRVRFIAEQTRPNSLFLSTAAQLDHAELMPVFGALGALEDGRATPLRASFYQHPALQADNSRMTLVKLLRVADVGVVEAKVVNERSAAEAAIERARETGDELGAEALQRSLDKLGDPHSISLGHTGYNGRTYFLDLDEESDGTSAFLSRSLDLLVVLYYGGLYVVDELEQALHPHLAAQLIALFTDPATNPKRAQLLFTSHDMTLLESLRRDEVVLVDKSNEGVTQLASLADFKVLKRDDIARVVREGRVGGVPRLGDLRRALRPAKRVSAGDEVDA